MRLFINEGILKRKWNGNVSIRQKDGRVTLRIPNYDEVTKEEPYFEFIIPNAKRKMLKIKSQLNQNKKYLSLQKLQYQKQFLLKI